MSTGYGEGFCEGGWGEGVWEEVEGGDGWGGGRVGVQRRVGCLWCFFVCKARIDGKWDLYTKFLLMVFDFCVCRHDGRVPCIRSFFEIDPVTKSYPRATNWRNLL